MEKINFKEVGVFVGLLAFAGLMFYTVSNFYGKSPAADYGTVTAQDTTLLHIDFKAAQSYEKVDTSLVDRGCLDVQFALDVKSDHIELSAEGTIAVFYIVETNPNNGNQVLVEDLSGNKLVFTLLSTPEGSELTKSWFIIEDFSSIRIFSTESECEALKVLN